MALQDDTPKQHIPAWKKLGLKLKYAQENSDSIIADHHNIVNEKKRKRSSDKDASTPDESVKSVKKKKTKVKKLGPTSNASNSETFEPSRGDVTSPPDQETPSHSGGARKSVSFTPDTKKTDGDSVKQLYQTWLNSHEAKDPSFDPLAFNPAMQVITSHTISSSTSQTQPTTTKKSKKAKRSRRSNVSQQSNGQGAGEFLPLSHQATLDYLFTYHTSDSPWKFSKTRQSHLLRHLFSPSFIPASYAEALEAYLSGLQGEGAKIRLRKEARKVRAEDSSHQSESQDLDKNGAQDATDDSTREKLTQTERDLKTKEEKKEEKENTENVTPTPPFVKTIPIPPGQIADLVLRIIGDDDNDNDNDAEAKEEEKQQPKPELQARLNNKTNLNNEQKKQPDPNNTTSTNTNHPHPQPYKKRVRKHKARVSPPDDDDDEESSSSSSGSKS